MLSILPGSWRVQQSTFPMWQKEGVHDVTFNYTRTEKKGETVLLDEVKYLKKDKPKTITGYDRSDPQDSTIFLWRGKGILAIAKSKWKVEWISEKKDCIIISFEKTAFTPAGIDILTRGTANPQAATQEALKIVKEKGLLKDIKDPMLPVR